jgi:hypothetical protein
VLQPGGIFVLNCKDHVRLAQCSRYKWHVGELQRQGAVWWIECRWFALAAAWRNGHLRIDFETVAVLRKGLEA